MIKYRPCKFNRNDYLHLAEDFENMYITDGEEEHKEFSGDSEHLAFELAYTRYYLAKAEDRVWDLEQQQERITTSAIEVAANCFCDKHQSEAKHQTFSTFQSKNNFCPLCVRESLWLLLQYADTSTCPEEAELAKKLLVERK